MCAEEREERERVHPPSKNQGEGGLTEGRRSPGDRPPKNQFRSGVSRPLGVAAAEPPEGVRMVEVGVLALSTCQAAHIHPANVTNTPRSPTHVAQHSMSVRRQSTTVCIAMRDANARYVRHQHINVEDTRVGNEWGLAGSRGLASLPSPARTNAPWRNPTTWACCRGS